MHEHSLPSIEKFAAFLDGNLPQDEMQQLSQMVEHDNVLHQLFDASSVVDNTLAGFSDSDLQLPPEIGDSINELPNLDIIGISPFVSDCFSVQDNLYSKEHIDDDIIQQQDSETLNNTKSMASIYRTYGQSGENLYDPIYIKQPDDHSCGLRSQQIVLRDFGIDIPFEDLERFALDAGVYSADGTYTYDIGKVLEMAGVDMHQVSGSTVYDLTNELAQGHRVIVSVDANELWYNDGIKGKLMNWVDDVFGSQGGNHALIVAGVEVNPSNPDDVKVVLTDPGAGHLRIEYPLNQFMDAWKDSNCFMVATDQAAPFQYDASTGMEVPSNFFTAHHFNQFVIDNGYQLNPDNINVPVGYHPAFMGHLDTLSGQTYDDFLNTHHLEPFHDLLGINGETAEGIGNLFHEDLSVHGHDPLNETVESLGTIHSYFSIDSDVDSLLNIDE